MYNRIKYIFLISFFLVFILFISNYYFSEKNILLVNKSRLSYDTLSKNKNINLPILKNDTNDIIVYLNDLEEIQNKRKKRFWEKLLSNDD